MRQLHMENVKDAPTAIAIKKTDSMREMSPAGVPIKFGSGPSPSSFATFMQQPLSLESKATNSQISKRPEPIEPKPEADLFEHLNFLSEVNRQTMHLQ